MLAATQTIASLVLLWTAGSLVAQEPDVPRERGRLLVTQYLPRDFQGHAQSTAIVQGGDGLIHVANPNGLITFDGQRWQLLSHPTQSRFVSLARAEDGSVFAGCDRDFGVVARDHTGRLGFTSWSNTIGVELVSVPQILVVSGGVYFHDGRRVFYVPVAGSTPLATAKRWEFDQNAFLLGEAHGRVYAWVLGSGLRVVEQGELVPAAAAGLSIRSAVVQCLPWDDDGVLLMTYQHGLHVLRDGEVTRPDWEVNGRSMRLFGCVDLGDRIALTTGGDGLVLCDRRGRIVRVIDATSGLQDSRCFGSPHVDRDGALWVPLQYGLGRVELSTPIEEFGDPSVVHGGGATIRRHAGRIHVTNQQGLFRLETSASRRTSAFVRHAGVSVPCNGLASLGEDLIVGTAAGIWVVHRGEVVQKLRNDRECFHIAPGQDGQVFAAQSDGLHVLERTDGSWRVARTLHSQRIEAIFSLVTDPASGTAYFHGRRRDGTTSLIPSFPDEDLVGVEGDLVSMALWRGGLLVCTGRGVFHRPPGSSVFLRDSTLSRLLEPLEWQLGYPTAVDDDHLWFQHEGASAVGMIDLVADPVLREPFARLRPGHPVRIYPEKDGTVWMGAADGNIYRYTRRAARPRSPHQTMIRTVAHGGNALDLHGGDLPFGEGVLRFEFALPTFDDPGRTRFRSRLVGLEADWQPWSAEASREFAALFEGSYRLEVEARDLHGTIANRAEFGFTILPPWYRTIWAYIAYLLVLSALGAGYASLRVRRSKRRIDALEEAQALLRESEARYRSLVETTRDFVWATDAEFRYTYVSPRFYEQLGYAPEDVLGRPLVDFVANEDRARVQSALRLLRDERVPLHAASWSVSDSEGKPHAIESSAAPVLDSDGALLGCRGIDRDVTARVTLERQLRQAQKLEAVGRFAGGVSHDFNNLLTVLIGQAESLSDGIRSGNVQESGLEHVEEILLTIQRASELTRQLLAFSRKQPLQRAVVDPNEVIEGLRKMLDRLIRDDIEMRYELAPHPARVNVDKSGLEQVLVNLVVNATDAMPKGGVLTIRTYADEPADDDGRHPEVRPPTGVVIAVSDTGTGMERDILQQIFEPFFTTKHPGMGTGLGLAMVHGIVEQSGGRVVVRSEPDRGTTFAVHLPAATRGELEPDKDLPPTASHGGNETILVCDDDKGVRRVTRSMLERFGYTVISATSPGHARELARQADPPIDLLLTDMVMPGMSGRALARLCAIDIPNLRVLFTSGYAMEPPESGAADVDDAGYIQKPYTTQELLRQIRALLDTGAPQRSPG